MWMWLLDYAYSCPGPERWLFDGRLVMEEGYRALAEIQRVTAVILKALEALRRDGSIWIGVCCYVYFLLVPLEHLNR